MTMILHIVIEPLKHGRFWRVYHDGAVLLQSERTPFCAAAREFVRRGYPPETRLTMAHLGKAGITLSGPLGKAAGLTVWEEPSTRFAPYQPFEDEGLIAVERHRAGRSRRDSPLPHTGRSKEAAQGHRGPRA